MNTHVVNLWNYSLSQPCIEGLFIAVLNQCKETLIPIIVNIIESNKASPNPDDMAAILKKDAVYNVFGLSVFELFDEVKFLYYFVINFFIIREWKLTWILRRSTLINGSQKS